MSLNVWDGDEGPHLAPPAWSLTGHMLLWNDGSPAHVQMEHFRAVDEGWEAALTISRSARDNTRWLPLRMRFDAATRKEWESRGTSARARALQALSIYLRLTEWHKDDLGVLELK